MRRFAAIFAHEVVAAQPSIWFNSAPPMRSELRRLLATGLRQKRIDGLSQSGRQLGYGRRGLLFVGQRAERIDREPSTSDNDSYRNRSQISHGNHAPTTPQANRALPETVPERSPENEDLPNVRSERQAVQNWWTATGYGSATAGSRSLGRQRRHQTPLLQLRD
jgi:hypothetical protein